MTRAVYSPFEPVYLLLLSRAEFTFRMTLTVLCRWSIADGSRSILFGTDEAFLGKTAVDQENCCLAFADAVSHYSMLGLSVVP